MGRDKFISMPGERLRPLLGRYRSGQTRRGAHLPYIEYKTNEKAGEIIQDLARL